MDAGTEGRTAVARTTLFAVATALVIASSGGVALAASLRNSVTFDEIFMMAAGARGISTGDFTMSYEHPPGMLSLYGAAARLAGARLPSETGMTWSSGNSLNYAQDVFFRSGNDPERIALAGRLVAVVFAMALGAAVALFAWRRAGPFAAFFSATIVMLLPDVMAHAGIAYNDLPLALLFMLGLWAWDGAVRDPTPARALTAGVVTGLALGVKFSALALGPAALGLFAAEAVTRRRDAAWYRRTMLLLPIALVVTWVVLALIYRGDFALTQFRGGFGRNVVHIGSGHGVPAMLLGRTSQDGFWYFFPVGLLLKTPAALHVLAIIAAVGFAVRWRSRQGSGRPTMRDLLGSPLRALVIGALVYFALLLRAKLNIGIRHALPLLPLVALMTGIGLARFSEAASRRARVIVAAVVMTYATSTLVYYPWFLSYLTEYVPDRRESGHRVMVDSNLDWGQGLFALRDFMRAEKIDGVYLSYFGSALPEAYGIKYTPLRSFLPLPAQPPLASEPKWVVISATNLEGLYYPDDPFRQFRERRPDRVIANSLYAYRLR